MSKYTAEAIEIAKRDGVHLVLLEINGKYAKKDTMTFSAPVGPETAKAVIDLFIRLLDVQERMK